MTEDSNLHCVLLSAQEFDVLRNGFSVVVVVCREFDKLIPNQYSFYCLS